MLRNSFFALLAGLLFFTGCPAPQEPTPVAPVTIQGNVVTVGHQYNFATSFLTALGCDSTQNLTWTITELSGPGTVNGIDGWVLPTGEYHAPNCGSLFLGLQMHLTAKCGTNGLTGTAVVNIGQEVIRSISVAAAQPHLGTPNACYDHTGYCTDILGNALPNPVVCDTALSVDTCGPSRTCQLHYSVGFGEQAQLYAKEVWSCQEVFVPVIPDPVKGLPACDNDPAPTR